MREILFRGKRTDNGEWVEGSLIHCDLSDGRSYTAILESDETKVHPMDWPYLCCYTGCIDGYANPVNPETVCQFTGLTDMNGKKIFEGDIVRYTERWFGGEDVPVVNVVEFMEGGFCVHNYFLNHWLWNSIEGNTQLSDIEVIGNIHDNPELLGGD